MAIYHVAFKEALTSNVHILPAPSIHIKLAKMTIKALAFLSFV